MENHGTRFIHGAVPTKLEKNDEGKIVVTYKQGDQELQEEFNTVLFAIGRTAFTEGLELDKAGLKVEHNGKLKVNEEEQTAVPHIYAIGDVVYG